MITVDEQSVEIARENLEAAIEDVGLIAANLQSAQQRCAKWLDRYYTQLTKLHQLKQET